MRRKTMSETQPDFDALRTDVDYDRELQPPTPTDGLPTDTWLVVEAAPGRGVTIEHGDDVGYMVASGDVFDETNGDGHAKYDISRDQETFDDYESAADEFRRRVEAAQE